MQRAVGQLKGLGHLISLPGLMLLDNFPILFLNKIVHVVVQPFIITLFISVYSFFFTYLPLKKIIFLKLLGEVIIKSKSLNF